MGRVIGDRAREGVGRVRGDGDAEGIREDQVRRSSAVSSRPKQAVASKSLRIRAMATTQNVFEDAREQRS